MSPVQLGIRHQYKTNTASVPHPEYMTLPVTGSGRVASQLPAKGLPFPLWAFSSTSRFQDDVVADITRTMWAHHSARVTARKSYTLPRLMEKQA